MEDAAKRTTVATSEPVISTRSVSWIHLMVMGPGPNGVTKVRHVEGASFSDTADTFVSDLQREIDGQAPAIQRAIVEAQQGAERARWREAEIRERTFAAQRAYGREDERERGRQLAEVVRGALDGKLRKGGLRAALKAFDEH